MARKILIGGYYGFGSAGDEAMLRVICDRLRLRRPDCEIAVLSAAPEKTSALLGVVGISRSSPAGVAGALAWCDLFVSGGGSLLQDGTSRRSLHYYSALIGAARLLGKRVYICANGIGPLSRTSSVRRVLGGCDLVTVRDPESLGLLAALGINAHLGADPVLLTEPVCRSVTDDALRRAGLDGRDFFSVSLRTCRGSRIDEAKLRRALAPAVSCGLTPLFVSMQSSYDLEICRRNAKYFGAPDVLSGIGIPVLTGIQSRARLAVGMRLHFLIAAAAAGTPCVPLSYDCKVENVIRYLTGEESLDAFSFDSSELAARIAAASAENEKARNARLERVRECAGAAICELDFLPC